MKNINKLFLLPFATATLLACNAEDGAPTGTEEVAPKAEAVYNPLISQVPSPIDLFFLGTDDLTLNLPSSSAPAQAANGIDGWSTIAPVTIKFNQELDPATVVAGTNIRIFRTCIDPLSIRPSPTAAYMGTPDGADYSLGELEAGTDYVANLASVSDPATGQTSDQVVKLRFLKPLKPKFDLDSVTMCPGASSTNKGAGYLVVMDNTLVPIKTVSGETVTASGFYQLTKGTTCLFRSPGDSSTDCPAVGDDDGSIGLTPAGEEAGLGTSAASTQATAETLRRLTNGHEQLAGLYGSATPTKPINPANIVLSWQFSPQSIGNVMDVVNQVAEATASAMPGLTWSRKEAGGNKLDTSAILPIDSADSKGNLYEGTITVPYYLGGPAELATAYWESEPSANPLLNGTTNLSFANPQPKKRSDREIPVFVVVPKVYPSGASMPVAVVQHGIGSNRTNIVAVAEALATAGVATVAIDLPLHGVTDSNIFQMPDNERTFGVITSGLQASQAFLNLSSLLTGRDNIRQAVADLLFLEEMLSKVTLSDGANSYSLDDSKLTYLGHSLGGIVGTSYLAYSDKVTAATLAMPGGGIAKLLDASAGFGGTVSQQLAAAGVNEGEKGFEDFLMLAQLAVDTGDPLNTASKIPASLPIHLIEVKGNLLTGGRNPPDVVVPNDAGMPFPGVDDMVPELGLGGTEPLIDALGLTRVKNTDGPQVFTAASGTIKHAVLFDRGHHSSILKPDDEATGVNDPAIMGEMLNEIAQFLGSGGLCLPVNANCPR